MTKIMLFEIARDGEDPVSDHAGSTYFNMLMLHLWTTQETSGVRARSFTALLLLFLLWITSMMPLLIVANSIDMSCHDANVTCYMKEECRVRMELLQSTCGPYGEYCSLPRPSEKDPLDQSYVGYCRSALHSIKKIEPNLRCYCTLTLSSPEYSKCMAVWRFLEQHPCVENPRWSTPNPPEPKFIPNVRPSVHLSFPISAERSDLVVATQLPVREQLNAAAAAGQASTNDEKSSSRELVEDLQENDCLTIMKRCDEQLNCQQARKNFLRACQRSDIAQCSVHRTNCLAAYENVRHFQLFSCTCSGKHRSNEKCRKHQSYFERNRCLDYYESQSMFGIGVAEGQQKSSATAVALGSSGLLPEVTLANDDQPTNCYMVYKNCARSSTCLKRMVRMAESCHWNMEKNMCHNYSNCLEALSTFYMAHTNGLSSAAVRCQCPLNDAGCLRQKELFQPRCAYQPQRTLSCLQLYAMCEKDPKRCYVALNLYSRTCDVDALARRCINSSVECERRRRIIWGTVLTLNCTCDPLESGDANLSLKGFRDTCNNIKNLLTNPPCLAPQYKADSKEIGNFDVFTEPKGKSEAEGKACQLIRDKYEENEVRLYHNTSCSQLCFCSEKNAAANCRQLPCVNATQTCQWSRYRKLGNSECRCSLGDMICTKDETSTQKTPGLYLSVAYSLSERRAVDQHASAPINLEQLGNLMSVMLSRTIGAQHQCRFHLVWQDAVEGQVLFRVNYIHELQTASPQQEQQQQQEMASREPLWLNARVRRSAAALQLRTKCHYPLRLLKILIDRGYPEITHHPHLSVVKAIRVLMVDDPTTKIESKYSEYAQRSRDAVNNMLGVLVPEDQADRGAAHKSRAHFLLFLTCFIWWLFSQLRLT